MLIKVIRFSSDGFVPKVQTHHLNLFKELFNLPDMSGLNEYQKHLIEISYQEYLPRLKRLNLVNWEKGIFAFFGGLPKEEEINHELNHLKNEEWINRKWYQGEISENAIVYSPYNLIPEEYTAIEYSSKYWRGAAAFVPSITEIYNTNRIHYA